MIDTHTHLYVPEFAIEGQAAGSAAGQCAAVDRALGAGVEMMVLPNIDRASVGQMKLLHELRPACTVMGIGLHPTEVKENFREELAYVMDELQTNSLQYHAVGEVGIDLYWDKTYAREQMEVFDHQLSVAERLGLPVIIHCREGLEQTLEVLSGHKGVEAVFHSFGGTCDDVDLIRRTGDYWFGINGIVTFKNSKLASVLPHIGIDRLLTETDSPYLAPVPFRGRRNESSYIPHILTTMAGALSKSEADVDAATTANAKRLFKLS